MQDSALDKLKGIAAGPKVPDGALGALKAKLEGMGFEAKPLPAEVERENLGVLGRAAGNVYNVARGFSEGAMEVAAAPVELAGILTGSDTLRGAAQGIRDVPGIGEDKMMASDGKRLVEPGFGSEVAQGFGSAAGFIAGGALMGAGSRVLGTGGKALGQASRLNKFADVALGTTMTGHAARLGAITGAQAQFRDAEAAGADPLQKWGALLGGAAIGATEGLAIGGTGQFARAAAALESIDTRSGGVISNMMRRGVVSLGTEGVEEAAQEGFQTFSEAMLAQQILKYAEPEEWDAIFNDTMRGALIGGLVGTGLSTMGLTFQDVGRRKEVMETQRELAQGLGEDVLGAVGESGSDVVADEKRVQKSPEEAAAAYFEGSGAEPSEFTVILPEESPYSGDEETQQKAQETAEKHPDLVGLLETIKATNGRTVPPVVVVEKGNPQQPAAYIDGVVVIDGSQSGEVQARLAMHELLHGRARVGSEGYTRLVEAAKAEFPTLSMQFARQYAEDFAKATGREPFAAIQDPTLRDAKLVEEGFAWAAENMQQAVEMLIRNERAFATDTEARSWIASIWDWLKGLVGKGSKGVRKDTIALLNSLTSDRIRVGEDLQPEEVLAVSRAIADVFRNVDQEVLRSVPFEEALPTVEPEAAPEREAEPEITEEDQAMADAVDVEAIAAEVDAEARQVPVKQPEAAESPAPAPKEADQPKIDKRLTPKQRRRIKQKQNRRRKREGLPPIPPSERGPAPTYRRDDTMSAAEDAIERFERGDERWAVEPGPTIEVDGVERPRLNSEGRPIAGSDEALRAFYAWFQDSAVVDEMGRPLVVYHGTPQVFTAFDTAKRGAQTGEESAREGFYFSSDPADARTFAEDFTLPGVGSPNIMPAYLSITDPVDVDFRGGRWSPDVYVGAAERARSDGRDGVVARNVIEEADGPSDIFVAFSPTQIKSATGNRGTFSPEEGDIRFAVAPQEGDIPLANLGKGLVGKGVRARQKYLTSRGLLPQSAFDAMIEERDSRVAVANQRIKNVAQDWRRAAKKVEGGMNELILSRVDAALRGEYPFEALPKPLQGVTRRMRDEIDEFSKALIASGAVEGDVIATVRANMGLYLTRTFRAFTDPKWMDKVPEEVKNWAKAYIRKRFEKRDRDTVKILEARADLARARAAEARVNAKTARKPEKHIERAERYDAVAEKYAKRAREFEPTPVDLEAEIRGILEDAKASGSPMSAMVKGKLGSKDLSILKRRKRIAPEIRALLGEEMDPLVNYAQSVMKMAHMIANQEFLNRVRDSGLEEGFFSKTRQGDNVLEIAAEASEVMRPLNGLYTSPDVIEAFSDVFDATQTGPIMRLYFKANASVKVSKTALSWGTQARNLLGGPFFLLTQGNLTPQFVGKAFGGFLAGMGWSTNAGRRAYIEDALKYGVIHESAQAGELNDIMRDATGVDHLYNPLKERGLLKRGFRVVLDLYQSVDDFYKLIAWEAEKASLEETNPEMTEAEVKRRAAHIVRVTNPTYSLVPRAVKAFRKNIVSGPFTSFPAEIVRISWNTGHLIKEELNDPKRRKRGLRRLAGAMASATLTKGIQMGTAFLMGYTDDDEEAMRHFAPEWSKNGDWAYLGEDREGRPRYVDLSYTDPFSYLKGVVNAALRGEDIADGLADSVGEVLEPFFGEELLAGALMDLRSNQTPHGGAVYNEADEWHKKGEDMAKYLWENAFEPGTLTSLRRIQKALNDEVSQGGKAYNAPDEVAAMLLGQRRSAVDVEQSLTFIALDYSSGISNSNKILSSVASRRGEVTEDEIRAAYESMEAARRRTFDETLKSVRYARRLELPDDVIEARLRGAGISEAQTKALLKGEYEPYEVTGQFLRFYERGADAERKQELRDRRKFVKALSQNEE